MTKARDLANIITGGFTADDIPALPASKITSGTLGADRIPDLATTKITSGTFANARLSSSSVTQHVDLTALSADNLTSGTVPSARLSASDTDLSADSSPQLSADLDVNSNDILMGSQSVKFGTSKWEIVLDTGDNDLLFKYNGTTVFKLASNGAVTSADNVTAFGSP
tara:strand:- start:1053 stop:1553 length:501 start_codon:yes stop_codon:yes gene_type:complete